MDLMVEEQHGLPEEARRYAAVLRAHMPELRERYKVSYLGLFGSYVRGEQRPDSDLDVLVEIDGTIGLLAYVGLKHHLEDLLGVSVDLVSRPSLRSAIGRNILREVVGV